MNKDGKAKILFGLLSLFIPLVVYLKTLCPTIYMGDSGEMVAAVYSLGIPHPAGYPVYTLLGKLFTLIFPVGNIAYRMNLFSAILASLTSLLIYLIALRIFKELNSDLKPWQTEVIALSTALILAFSQIFWERAVTGKAYTLQTFFMGILIMIVLPWNKEMILRRPLPLFIFSFLLGISIGVHITTILFLPAFAIFILLYYPKLLLEFKKLIGCLFSFVFGLSVYLYIPLRAAKNPPINWGNPDNWENFVSFITLKDRGADVIRSFASFPVSSTPNIFASLFRIFLDQMPLFFLIIGGMGFLYLMKKNFRLFLLLSLMFFPYTLFFARYRGPLMNMEHFIPSVFLMSLWIGSGLYALIIKLGSIQKIKRTGALLTLLCLFLPALSLIKNYTYNDRSSDYHAYDYGWNVLESMEEDGVIFARGDVSVFPLYYLQVVEKLRPDVKMICVNFLGTKWYLKQLEKDFPSLSGRLFPDQPGASIYEITRLIINKRPVYLDVVDSLSPPGFITVPNGIIYKLSEKDRSLVKENLWSKYSLRGITHQDFLKSPYHSILFRIYADAHYNGGSYYEWKGMIDDAQREYESAVYMEVNILGGFKDIKEMGPEYFELYPDRKERFVKALYSLTEIYRYKHIYPEKIKEILAWIIKARVS